jgi:succinate dehydrogenase / fumarate reductase flavoprotein subunit
MKELRQTWTEARAQDGSKSFNSDFLELLELKNLLDLAHLTAVAARERRETRGAHARDDFPERDDDRWLRHSLSWLTKDGVRMGSRPVDISTWKPKPRVY